MTEEVRMIENDGFKYFKKNDQWYQESPFFKDSYPIKQELVPDCVKTEWNNLMEQQIENDQNEIFENMAVENARESSIDVAKSIPPAKSHSKKAVKKKGTLSDPRLQHAMSKKAVSSINFSSSPASSVVTIEGGGLTPIIVTDSQQLIRPLRAELRSKMLEDAKELEKRMEIRKNIMTIQDVKTKPFEPKKKQSEESMLARNESRRKMAETAEQMISKLERIKKARKMLTDLKQGEEEQMVAKVPRLGKIFEIERLSEFASANNVTVLNLDKFICATDKRRIIYNEKGVCIFCSVHGLSQSVEKHQDDRDCPFFFCTCAHCYMVGKLGEKGVFLVDK